MGVDTEIDFATLGFQTPIFISPPAKVKKLGVITNVIMSIFDETKGTIDLGQSMPELNAYDDSWNNSIKNKDADGRIHLQVTTASGYDAIVTNTIVQLGKNGISGEINWREVLESEPGEYAAGLSKIYLNRIDLAAPVVGTFALNNLDETQIIVNWDEDTIPTNTVLGLPNSPQKGTIDAIIDPTRVNPVNLKVAGTRILLLGDIGATANTDGADAWKDSSGNDTLVASENDIIEWSGTQWQIVFDSSTKNNPATDVTYTTNLTSGIQYKWDGTEWTLSFEGEYRKGSWRLVL